MAGTKRVVVRILTIIALIFMVVFAFWFYGWVHFKHSTHAPSSTAAAAASATPSPASTTYASGAYHFSFVSSPPLRLVRTYTVKGNAVGNWWHAEFAVRTDQLAKGERTPFFEVAVLKMPFAVPATGKYGPSYQSKTKLEIELYGLSKADPTAEWSALRAMDVGGAKGWVVVGRLRVSGVSVQSLIAYTVRQSRFYRLEFSAPVADWRKWSNLCAFLMATFRLE